jgi:hypothetical protein
MNVATPGNGGYGKEKPVNVIHTGFAGNGHQHNVSNFSSILSQPEAKPYSLPSELDGQEVHMR